MTKKAPPDEFRVSYSAAILAKHPEWKPHLEDRDYAFGSGGKAWAPVPPPQGNTPEEIAKDLERRSRGKVPAEFGEIVGLSKKIKLVGRQRIEGLTAIAGSPNALSTKQIRKALGLKANDPMVGNIVGYDKPGSNEQSCHRDNLVARHLVDVDKVDKKNFFTATELGKEVAKVLQGSEPRLGADEAAENEPGEAEGYQPDDEDRRKTVERQIKERRGQQRFRQALRKRYHDRCVVTGCQLVHVLEAAHICAYRGEKDNDPSNGLLLRSDIHTLFDLDLLGIEPKTLEVKLHPAVVAEYGEFEGRSLRLSDTPSDDALRKRYEEFQRRLEESG